MMMKIDDQNEQFKLAYALATETNRSIYLTGKAGTGKTTFLKYLKANCPKNMVVVAPTGVAAINAGGVTIHSFFQLPIGPYIPYASKGFGLNDHVVNKNTLLKNMRVGHQKKMMIEELELLVIDEVSMLRSDTLDAIDTALKFVRRNNLAFGGVQVLFIGDLYQLPPVVTDRDKPLLDELYVSPFFFHAKVLEFDTPIYIELKKIYRQNEQSFIDLLNRLRNNNLQEEDYTLLDSRYQPNFKNVDNKYITLTSHNAKADAINQSELRNLQTTLYEFQGEIKGDFGDKQHPTELNLKLKQGAQVMFVKNDSSTEKRYYNGKIGIIHKIDDEEIFVQFADSKDIFKVEKETWDNINYAHNEEKNEIEENVVGRFIQYPLRLAWAITIHKSQGLTFTHAIIDAGESFAPGQVYVALIRCTSLDGVILRSRISNRALHTDERIFRFNTNEMDTHSLTKVLNEEKLIYQADTLRELFDWRKMFDAIHALELATLKHKSYQHNLLVLEPIRSFKATCYKQQEIATKFQHELISLLREMTHSQNMQALQNRVSKAIVYFAAQIHTQLIQPLQNFAQELDKKQATKKYLQTIQHTESIWWNKIEALQKARYNNTDFSEGLSLIEKAPVKIVAPKKEKGESAKESLAYFLGGKSVAEISEIRKYAVSTIESHLAQFIETGELEITQFLTQDQLIKIAAANATLPTMETGRLTQLKDKLNHEFGFGELRIALSFFKKNKPE